MGVEQTNNDNKRFRCDNCDRSIEYGPNPCGPTEESARVAGWRIGAPYGSPACYCPECTGVNEDYWDARTLTIAQMAGIDAGNTAWGQS